MDEMDRRQDEAENKKNTGAGAAAAAGSTGNGRDTEKYAGEYDTGSESGNDGGIDIDSIEFVKNDTDGQGQGAALKEKKGLSIKTGIFIIILLVIVLTIGGIIAYYVSGNSASSSDVDYGSDPYVGVLVISGEITGSDSSSSSYHHDWIMKQVRKMKKDSNNEGIMLYVNSPGGGVFESDELYNALESYKKKTKRPLYAYFDKEAASGAYYISADADKIIANELCTTGSIGVYMGPVIDSSVLLRKLGVSVDYIKSGANKAMGNPFQPLTAEQRQIYQEQVDEYYQRFAGIVSRGRNMPLQTVYKVGDGRSYTASQALDNGLVDKLGSFSKARKIMKKDCKISGRFVTVQYQEDTGLLSYLTGVGETFRQYVREQGQSETEKTMDYLTENGKHVFYYESFD